MKQCFYASIVVILICVAALHARADHSQVLYISSYNPSFHSFGSQINGIREALGEHYSRPERVGIDIEFMDAKSYPGLENIKSFRTRLALKLEGQKPPDVLIVGDDIAFKFALSERDDLFANIPVVFLGVNNVPLALDMNSDDQFTGVVEKASLGETLSLAASLTDKGGKIYVITDPTRTGRINFNEFTKTAEYKEYGKQIEVLSLITMSYEDLQMKLEEIEPGSVINFLSAFQDSRGATKTERDISRMLKEYAKVPFVHAWETHLGSGSIGGKVVSHYEQGRQAGILVANILNGGTPAEIPVVSSSPNKLVIDYAVMKAFGYEEDLFPSDVEFINYPETLLNEYREYVVIGGVFVVIQSGIIFLLVLLNRRRKSAEASLRESQQRFHDFASSSSDWFWEMDDQLRFSYFSDRFEEVVGVSPSKLLGKTRQQTGIPGVEVEEWIEHLETLKNHRPFREFIHPRNKDGETVWVAINGEPVFDSDGVFLGYRGTGADITERRAADEALRSALRTTEQANQSKSNFLAMMSHEFRTPLNAILGFSDILRREVFGPIGNSSYTEYASDIHDSGKHMLALVNDVLDISAVEAGKRQFDREDIEVSHLLEECVRSMRQVAIDRDITVSIQVPSDIPMLHTDRRAAMQILYNLLSNSIKYTTTGGGVELSVSVNEQTLFIDVSDTGVGISKEKLSSITEPFSRSHSDPMIAQEEGTGLGLAIVASLVHELGAELSFKSTVGEGTTATVAFPLDQEADKK